MVTSIRGIFMALIRPRGDRTLNQSFGDFLSPMAQRLTGIQVDSKDARARALQFQPCIYVGNHQSGLDLMTYGTMIPRAFVTIGKEEVKWIPVFGYVFRAYGNLLIRRQDRAHSVAGLKVATQAIRDGWSVWIFPEGTRNRSGKGLLPFKKGAFHMAMQAQVPLVPVISSSLSPLVSWKERRFRAGWVVIRTLDPIMPTNSDGSARSVTELMELTRAAMLQGLQSVNLQAMKLNGFRHEAWESVGE
jgi:1-acyl-sn-glycerol-3-phosphate acyltransferase